MNMVKRSANLDGVAFRCTICFKFKSIRTGTFFELSKLTLYQIFAFIFMYCRGMSNQNLMKTELNVSAPTVVNWKNFVRDVHINHIINNNSKIGGAHMYVQIDESICSKRKYGVGRILVNQDLWIVGGIDEAGNIFMEITERRNKQTLADIITRNVEPGSIIQTDGWAAYRGIERYNYVHEVVIHDRNFVSESGVHTNRIESTWGACKRLFSHIRNKQRDMIFGYLAEYVFKKKFEGSLMLETIREICRIYNFE